MRKSLITLAAIMLVLTACVPGQTPVDVQAQVDTAVAQTMSAQDQVATSVALTVAAQNPTSTSTAVFTATSSSASTVPTLTPVIPTVTPLNTPSSGSGSGSGSGSNVADYSCDIIRRRPLDNTEFNREADFDIKWTIINTGTKAWPAGFDLKYFSGPHLVTPTRIELPAMKPKAQFDIVFDAKAPTQKGFHVMTWVVEGKLCFPYTAIIVK